jgi:hypothetical protein
MKLFQYLLTSLTAVAIGFLAGPNLEARDYGMAGCGLGSKVVTSNGFNQVWASTTNQTSSNQTWAISSGTSNCVGDDVAFQKRQQEYFVAINFESLQQEMAIGKGEKLTSLAGLLGCPTSDLGRMTRKEYKSLFASNVTPETLLNSVRANISQDKNLASACQVAR